MNSKSWVLHAQLQMSCLVSSLPCLQPSSMRGSPHYMNYQLAIQFRSLLANVIYSQQPFKIYFLPKFVVCHPHYFWSPLFLVLDKVFFSYIFTKIVVPHDVTKISQLPGVDEKHSSLFHNPSVTIVFLDIHDNCKIFISHAFMRNSAVVFMVHGHKAFKAFKVFAFNSRISVTVYQGFPYYSRQ